MEFEQEERAGQIRMGAACVPFTLLAISVIGMGAYWSESDDVTTIQNLLLGTNILLTLLTALMCCFNIWPDDVGVQWTRALILVSATLLGVSISSIVLSIPLTGTYTGYMIFILVIHSVTSLLSIWILLVCFDWHLGLVRAAYRIIGK